MKYAIILFTLYFTDDEIKKRMKIFLKENEDEKKQIEDFICSFRNIYNFLNIDFNFLLVESVNVYQEVKNEIDITTLKI